MAKVKTFKIAPWDEGLRIEDLERKPVIRIDINKTSEEEARAMDLFFRGCANAGRKFVVFGDSLNLKHIEFTEKGQPIIKF